MEINMKDLTNEEINLIISQLKAELRSREAAPQLVVYSHDCQNSANHHKNKYKHWCKLVSEIDLTKADGYAFIGQFLQFSSENMLVRDSIVVEVCGIDYTAYRVTGDHEKEKICTARRGSIRSMITTISNLLAGGHEDD